jgi:hypothetical protein
MAGVATMTGTVSDGTPGRRDRRDRVPRPKDFLICDAAKEGSVDGRLLELQ